jgi:hypothetical protein
MMKNIVIILIFVLCAFFFIVNGCRIPENTDGPDLTADNIESGDTGSSGEVPEGDGSEENDGPAGEEEPVIEAGDQLSGELDSVTLTASHVGGKTGDLSMDFDLKTGDITGYLEMEFDEVHLDGNSTIVCLYFVEGSISGTLDLDTRIIEAVFIGKSVTEDRGCFPGDMEFTLEGKISEDFSVARGTTSFGPDWSIFK